MKRIITLAAVLAAHAIATASPAMLAPRLPDTRLAVELPSPGHTCAYRHIKAAVLMRELIPSLPAITARGCTADTALAHLIQLEDEGHVERVSMGWRVK